MKSKREIYTAAARAIAEGEEYYSCIAIAKQMPRYQDWNRMRRTAAARNTDAVVNPYINMMSDGGDLQAEIECDPDGIGAQFCDQQDFRVLLLCFMAAMS